MEPTRKELGEQLHALAQEAAGLGTADHVSGTARRYWQRLRKLKAVKQWLAMPWSQAEVPLVNRCRHGAGCHWDRCQPRSRLRCDLLTGSGNRRHVGEMKFTFGKLAPWTHGGGQTAAQMQLAHYCQSVCTDTAADTTGSVLVVALNLDDDKNITYSRARIIDLPLTFKWR